MHVFYVAHFVDPTGDLHHSDHIIYAEHEAPNVADVDKVAKDFMEAADLNLFEPDDFTLLTMHIYGPFPTADGRRVPCVPKN